MLKTIVISKIRLKRMNVVVNRFLCDLSAAEVNAPIEKKLTKLKKSKPKSEELFEYLKEFNLETVIPIKFLRVRCHNSDYAFTIDPEVAKEVVTCISAHLSLSPNTTVVECNPGIGLITRELLASGVPKLKVFDSSAVPSSPMQDVYNSFGDKIERLPHNMFQIHKLLYMDKLDNGLRVEAAFEGFQHNTWEQEPAVKIIGVVTSPGYVKHLVGSFLLQSKVLNYGRQEHYIIVSAYVYHTLIRRTARSFARMLNCSILQIVMDVTLLCTLPRKAFLPWLRTSKKVMIDDSFMYLIKLVPKQDLYSKLTPDQWTSFWFFMRALCSNRSNRIIPMFEKWVPGSGLLLISKGLSVSTEVQDLQDDEILQLYKLCINLPSYDHIKFLHSVEVLGEDLETAELSSVRRNKR